MQKIVIHYKNFSALKEAFGDLGFGVIDNAWEIKEADFRDITACVISINDCVRWPKNTLRLKRQLRRYRIPLIGLDRDAPWHNGIKDHKLWLLKKLRVLDLYATHSLQSATGFAPQTIYFPNAAWTRHYNLASLSLSDLRREERYLHDVSFVGNLNAKRYPEHRQRVVFFEELERRLKARGIRTFFVDSSDSAIPVGEQIEIIQRSKINLNYGAACDDSGTRSWGLPERCFGIPACGGFQLCDQRKHAYDDFEVGKEIVLFEGLDDCEQKIRHYLEDFDRIRAIAEAGHKRVTTTHTYLERARQLTRHIRDWHQRRQRLGS